ncbi:MAG: ubiquinone/menaquinone biosynthesis methyltransferase [Elusimicrobia bacterium]|nr:ubiquinone/menaquinone biosynthesis methyltransferase [Elusimicrobiota bacterium]
MFNGLAGKYEQFNSVSSLGLDRIWRNSLIRSVGLENLEGKVVLDFGTGTGDLIRNLAQKNQRRDTILIGMDFSKAMIQWAKTNLEKIKRGEKSQIEFLCASGENVPLLSESVDVVMSAFVLRNIRKIMIPVLSELKRVMRPGGKLFFLEMVVPENSVLKFFHRLYLKSILPLVGYSLFKKNWSGSYLSETILNFGKPAQFSQILIELGFEDVCFSTLSGGMAVLHRARKA